MERSKAQELGKVRYKTGRVCVRGHRKERYTTSGQCVECCRLKGQLPNKVPTPQQLAKMSGHKFYYGKRCPKYRHGRLKYTSCGACVQCRRVRTRKYIKRIKKTPEGRARLNEHARKYCLKHNKLPYNAICLPQTIEQMPLRKPKVEVAANS